MPLLSMMMFDHVPIHRGKLVTDMSMQRTGSGTLERFAFQQRCLPPLLRHCSSLLRLVHLIRDHAALHPATTALTAAATAKSTPATISAATGRAMAMAKLTEMAQQAVTRYIHFFPSQQRQKVHREGVCDVLCRFFYTNIPFFWTEDANGRIWPRYCPSQGL